MICLRRVAIAVACASAFTLAVEPAAAQTPYIPYFGKNQIRYDKFSWYTYETDHFVMYYYPEIEPHLERMAGYAESAYQHVSSELKYDLAHKVPLILFQTSSEFQQQNVIPGAAQEGVGAFAEPTRQRIVMPMDEPPDLLYRLIVHELTHQFDYDIIPASLVRRGSPLWIHEGLADYMTGEWRPQDLMSVRDAAVADIIPKMSKLEGYADVGGARMIYNLGHAIFEFIESKWGKDGLRSYLFSLRKSVIGGGEDAYTEAFKITAEEFDQQFDKYLKDRFKPFRDKERPADYGRNLGPNPERTPYRGVYTAEPSPSGDLIAIFTGNRPRPRGRHHPRLAQGRLGRPQADQRLRQGQGIRVHLHAWRPLGHRALAHLVGDGRSSRVLRPHREIALAHHAERADLGRRGPHRDAHPR